MVDEPSNREEFSPHALTVEAEIRAAVRQALIEHKRAGNPIVVSDEHGCPCWIVAEDIEIPDEPTAAENQSELPRTY